MPFTMPYDAKLRPVLGYALTAPLALGGNKR